MAKSVTINGVTYPDVPSVDIPLSGGGGDATFYEISDATGAAADVLTGKDVYGPAGLLHGSMPNNGAVSGNIATLAGVYQVPAGYHNGSGTVGVAAAEAAKLVPGNIRGGVTVLGVVGDSNVVDTSDANATAAHVSYGKTAYVGGTKITGTLTSAQVSQDSTTKVLSIV